jgi:hypothetical protein
VLALLGIKKPAGIVTIGAGGGRFSVTTGAADVLAEVDEAEDFKLDVL